MIEGIINTLNLTLETTGRIDKRYCLTEQRTSTGDNSTTVPYAIEPNGQLNAVDYGNPSLSWWRVTSPFSIEEVTTTSAVNKKQATYSLRLVVMYRRKESTADNGFTPAWLAEDIGSVLTQSNGDLKTVLKAADVRVSVTSTDIDTTRVWNEEFKDLEFKDPKYVTCLIAFELSVTVIARPDCWETECNYDTDILHVFDFCKTGTFDRLTDEQKACLTTALCGDCADVTIQVDGNTIDTTPAGSTYSFRSKDTAGTTIGTIANPSVIADNTINFNGADVDTVKAEESYAFLVKLDGINSGTYNAGTNTVSVVSAVCADATTQVNAVNVGTVASGGTFDQQIHDSLGADVGTAANPSVVGDATATVNGVSMATIPAEGTENIEVRQETGATLVGSQQGQYWRIDDSQAQVNGVNTETIAATVTHDQQIHDSAGADIGTAANPSVVSDTTVQNNATPTWTDTVEAEGTLTLAQAKALDSDGATTLLADYIPSADGFMFTCTPATTPSLSVALSAATIEFGSALTITATPTDITPTNYYAWSECSDESLTKIGSQAGNVFTWAVNSKEGANTIRVIANDGSASAMDIAGDALTVTTVYLNNAFGGALGLWSATKRSESFASAWGRVRRSSDNDEADFSLLTGAPERFDNTSIASNSSPASHDGDTFATFIGATNGFVPNIYDQAGSSDGSQTTAASQPKIATTGTINTNSGYPSLTFDGNDNFKVWNNTTAPAAYQGLSDAITIVAWVKPSAVISAVGWAWSPTFTLVELRVNSSSSTTKVPFSFGFDNSRLRCGFTDNYTTNAENVISNSTFTAGNIRMVAVTINGDVVKLYRDGLLDIEQTLTVATGNRSVGALNSSLIIGSRSRDGGQADSSYYSGDVMDIAIYDTVLSDDDISKLRSYYLS